MIFQSRISKSCEIEDSILTASQGEASRLEAVIHRGVLRFFWLGTVAFLVLLAARVFFLNVVKGDYYVNAAAGNSIRSVPLPAPRGKIYDRNGMVLVNNLPATDIVASKPSFPSDMRQREEIANKLARILEVNENEILEKFKVLDSDIITRVVVKKNVSQDEMLRFAEWEDVLPAGIALEQSIKRRYEDGIVFSHILGYTGMMTKEDKEKHPEYLMTDLIGRDGLEQSYDANLRGIPGAKKIEVDANGRVQRQMTSESALAGSDLVLSIDAKLQKKLFGTLEDELKKSQLKRGAAVAMNPNNGEILALVSLPSFDNNVFSEKVGVETYKELFENPDHPLFNRVISGEYAPGSTIKPMLAAAALAERVISEFTRVESKGGIQVGSFFFGDWKVHGFTDVREAIAVSSDVFFYALGGGWGEVSGLGMERMKRYEELFGFGSPTGIDLKGEAAGFLPDPSWKEKVIGERWYIGNTYHASIGQGYVKSTPLQLAVATSAIANGGTIFEPRVVSRTLSATGESTNIAFPKRREDIFDNYILRIVREGMRMTVTDGTAQELKEASVEVAGKTGTAQYGNEGKTNGWFVSYAPYDKPEIVMVVLVEGQGESGYHAVPVTRKVYDWYFGEYAQERRREK